MILAEVNVNQILPLQSFGPLAGLLTVKCRRAFMAVLSCIRALKGIRLGTLDGGSLIFHGTYRQTLVLTEVQTRSALSIKQLVHQGIFYKQPRTQSPESSGERTPKPGLLITCR